MSTEFLIIRNDTNFFWNENKNGFGQLFNNLKDYSPAKESHNVKHSSATHLRPAPCLTSVPQHLRHTKTEPFTCTWLGIEDLQGDSLGMGILRDWWVTHGKEIFIGAKMFISMLWPFWKEKNENHDTPSGWLIETRIIWEIWWNVVRPCGGFLKWGYPEIMHFSKIFHEINSYWGNRMAMETSMFLEFQFFKANPQKFSQTCCASWLCAMPNQPRPRPTQPGWNWGPYWPN